MHDIAEFLRTHDPFKGLDEEALERLAERTEVEFFEAGRTIFEQGAPPQNVVRIVRRGEVELRDRGRVLDLLGEGEMFGHPSMLSGMPTSFEARAHEDSLCYAMTAADAKPLLARPDSLPYLARSLLRRRKSGAADETEVASAETAQQAASALIRRSPLICRPGTPVREIAREMDRENSSAALVRRENGDLGIVTDRDLRSRVVGEGRSMDTPVEEVMSSPVYTVPANATGADLMVMMLDNNVRHVTVLSPKDEVMGVVTGIDLVAAESRAPFVLRRAIAEANSNEELREVAGRLGATVIALHRARLAPEQVSQVISVVADALVKRIIELAIEREGTPPAEFAWLALGSHGRREAVPSSDVDSGMAWRDGSGEQAASEPTAESGVARYMHSIAEEVDQCLKVIGWRLDPHGVTARGRFSASSIGEWRATIESWLEHPGKTQVLIATSILLDGRVVVGPQRGLDPGAIIYEPEQRQKLERSMLRLALASKPPTGFRRDIVVDHEGERCGTFDIKHGGLLPVTDLARYAALRADVDVLSTIERLRAAGRAGAIEPTQAQTLEEAHELFAALRLEHQVQQLEAGEEPDDHLDPKELNPLARRYLRDAFREVAAVQRTLHRESTSLWPDQ